MRLSTLRPNQRISSVRRWDPSADRIPYPPMVGPRPSPPSTIGLSLRRPASPMHTGAPGRRCSARRTGPPRRVRPSVASAVSCGTRCVRRERALWSSATRTSCPRSLGKAPVECPGVRYCIARQRRPTPTSVPVLPVPGPVGTLPPQQARDVRSWPLIGSDPSKGRVVACGAGSQRAPDREATLFTKEARSAAKRAGCSQCGLWPTPE